MAETKSAVIWNQTPGPSVPWKWHKEELFDKFVECSELLLMECGREATWAVCGTGVARLVVILDRFQPMRWPGKDQGAVKHIGFLGGFDCYRDTTLDRWEWAMGFNDWDWRKEKHNLGQVSDDRPAD